MRKHRIGKKTLSRTTGHRKALLKNLSRSLILDGEVKTTLTKAKFVKPYVEKLVTKAKKSDNISNINFVDSKLGSTQATRKLFSELTKEFKDRNGGYTRIVKLGFRSGDKAPMAKIEWVKDKKTAKSEKVAPEKESKTKEPVEDSKEKKKKVASKPAAKKQESKKSTKKEKKESK